jgi:signal transduction histidine kinase/ActR/RegA family two-component response regulator
VPTGLDPREERVLVYAMLGADAAHTSRLLASAGITTETVTDVAALCRGIREGAGAVFLAEETLLPSVASTLLECIDEQPLWSDVPIVVSVIERDLIGSGYGLVASLGQQANVTLLERPVNARAMVRAVQSALRARRRQYEARNLVDELGRARDLAEANSRARDEFLATLSHELRTPLNAILGWTRLLRGNVLDPEKRERALASVERSAVAQTQLIEDLLDVSRAASGKLRLSPCSLDPADVVKSALDAMRPTALSKGIDLSCTVPPSAPAIIGDRERLEQVMRNLLGNAIKFTRTAGRVQVSIEDAGRYVEIVVTDDGMGIAPEFMPYVFQRFRQADPSTTRAYGGLGIGLSIVKSIVELHGGSVTASSPGREQGSSFIVRIPAAPRTEAVDAASAGAIARGEIHLQPSSLLAGLRILVVDDEPDSADLLKELLQAAGATVATACSAATGFEHVAANHPDVLVSDISMPGEDGFTFIGRVRSLGRARIPALAVTAYARAEDRARALAAGFDMHVSKPIEPAELVDLVDTLARQCGARATAS